MIKQRFLIFLIFLMLGNFNLIAQETIAVFANKRVIKNLKVGPNLKADRIVSDTMILYSNGTFRNRYSDVFFDDLHINILIGEYKTEDGLLYLFPKFEEKDLGLEGSEYLEDISMDFEDVKCKIIRERKLKCKNFIRFKYFRSLYKLD